MNKNFIFFLKLIAAVIMLQTLFLKFAAAQESINLFTEITGENEAFVRYATGIIELIASILFFIPKKSSVGALLALGLMFGAIVSHLTILGIEYNSDNGLLFYSAIITFIASTIIFYDSRKTLPFIGCKL